MGARGHDVSRQRPQSPSVERIVVRQWPQWRAGEGVSMRIFHRRPVNGKKSSRKFLQPRAGEGVSLSNFHRRPVNGKNSSRKFLQPRAVGRISLSNFHRRPVNGKNYSKKFLQPKVVGRISSEKHLHQPSGGGISAWKELSECGGLLLRLLDGTAEGGQLVVYLLQFALVATVGHDAASGLIPKLVVAADEGADGDGLRHVAI